MRFFILGNINCGKSTLAKHMQLYLKSKGLEYPILSIDDFRIKYGDGSQEKEDMAQNKFYLSVKNTRNAIIEMVGFGNIGTKIVENLDKNSCIIIYVESQPDICIKRLKIKNKILERIPYPESINNIEQTILHLDNYFKIGKLKEKWNNVCLKLYKINTTNNPDYFIEKLPIYHYHYLSEIIYLLKSLNYKKLISFGGLGRCDINIFSDIDLILITKRDIIQIYSLLKNFFESKKEEAFIIYILEEKIIIKFFSCILIEIAVISNFSKYILFYHGSNIKDISKSILIGDEKLEKEIKSQILSYVPNTIDKEINIKKLYYYLELLQKAYLNNDDFRFYFMNNLVINQIIRILCLKENITEFLYCPKNINKLLKKYKVRLIFWDMITDKQEHIKILSNFLASIGINYNVYTN